MSAEKLYVFKMTVKNPIAKYEATFDEDDLMCCDSVVFSTFDGFLQELLYDNVSHRHTQWGYDCKKPKYSRCDDHECECAKWVKETLLTDAIIEAVRLNDEVHRCKEDLGIPSFYVIDIIDSISNLSAVKYDRALNAFQINLELDPDSQDYDDYLDEKLEKQRSSSFDSVCDSDDDNVEPESESEAEEEEGHITKVSILRNGYSTSDSAAGFSSHKRYCIMVPLALVAAELKKAAESGGSLEHLNITLETSEATDAEVKADYVEEEEEEAAPTAKKLKSH